jgi:hypothetical protein
MILFSSFSCEHLIKSIWVLGLRYCDMARDEATFLYLLRMFQSIFLFSLSPFSPRFMCIFPNHEYFLYLPSSCQLHAISFCQEGKRKLIEFN